MGEKKGMLFTILIIGAFIVPALLDFWVSSVRTDQFMKIATEMHQIVESEGGAGTTATAVARELGDVGMQITFSPAGIQPVGTEVVMRYYYKYDGVFGNTHVYDTTNKVIVSRR